MTIGGVLKRLGTRVHTCRMDAPTAFVRSQKHYSIYGVDDIARVCNLTPATTHGRH